MLNRSYYFWMFVFIFSLVSSCKSQKDEYEITISNNLDHKRTNESVEIWLNTLDAKIDNTEMFKILDDQKEMVPSQLVDIDSDSIYDYVVFQTDIEAKASKTFNLVPTEISDTISNTSKYTVAKFVPERIDDFAWENDLVAFRTYGPECQRLFEANNPAGLISSGMDCWLKRVDYPIIDKWYANHQKGISYHQDHGEGLDNYHVGTTRGCGGTALICDGNTILSENFTSSKIIANGPIRTIFELIYDKPMDVCGSKVSEKKTISIDLGSHFYQCDVAYTSKTKLETSSAGITLHKGKGTVKVNEQEGWISYWEPLDDSFLGTAILMQPEAIANFDIDETIHEDESLNNISIHSKLTDNSFRYWAGFGWKKQGDYTNHDAWTKHLTEIALRKNEALTITITKK